MTSRPAVLAEIRHLVRRMAEENSTWATHGFRVLSKTSGTASVNDCTDHASIGDPAGTRASDVLADVRASALG